MSADETIGGDVIVHFPAWGFLVAQGLCVTDVVRGKLQSTYPIGRSSCIFDAR